MICHRQDTRRARLTAAVLRQPGGLSAWNVGVDYACFYADGVDPDQKRIVAQLYERDGLRGGAGVAVDLNQINAQPRLQDLREGVGYWRAAPRVHTEMRHLPAGGQAPPDDVEELGTPRFRALYRQWLEDPTNTLWMAGSTTLADALDRDHGRVEFVATDGSLTTNRGLSPCPRRSTPT